MCKCLHVYEAAVICMTLIVCLCLYFFCCSQTFDRVCIQAVLQKIVTLKNQNKFIINGTPSISLKENTCSYNAIHKCLLFGGGGTFFSFFSERGLV